MGNTYRKSMFMPFIRLYGFNLETSYLYDTGKQYE